MEQLWKGFVYLLCWLPLATYAQPASNYVAKNYEKTIHQVEMRDGIKLYTVVYAPKDKSKTYPMMLKRTCYSVAPYGIDKMPSSLGPNPFMMEAGYIFVYQDVRGRWMSEGEFDNMRPNIPGNDPNDKTKIDESSDAYDTMEWLLANVENHNGRIGQWGISYPGYYTAAALPDAHPALKASSPQAPISDFFFDDFHHMGAFIQGYLPAFPVFGYQSGGPTTTSWYNNAWDDFRQAGNYNDTYAFNMSIGPLKNVTEKYYPNDFFWRQVVEHPNYDEFWQKRSILPHLKGVDHAVMTVGGWFDAEDLYGPLNIYKTLEKNNPGIPNMLVMGPWSHGDWSRERGTQAVNHIYFGDSLSTFYQKNIETPFFEYHLKDQGTMNLPEAYLFDSGLKEWKQFQQWPSKDQEEISLGFGKNGQLLINQKGDKDQRFSYLSDPANPVPFRSEIVAPGFTPRAYMTDDQRHASRRPDVLTFQTDVLDDPMTLSGEIMAKLKVMLSVTDADFIVKLIDVYPDDTPPNKATPAHITMAGYQQLVRAETFRGRFRNSFSKPEPFTPGKVETVEFPLQDVLHTFKKGHRIMVQVHSTWFPYIDRNPQKYVENIYKADAEDFTKGSITIMGDSKVVVGENDGVESKLEAYRK
ncbi:MAG: CocE/NonD family hydrolase [Saprospiraceae bacterium]